MSGLLRSLLDKLCRLCSRKWVISIASVICPYCARENIQPDARFCDRCGSDLSNFWKTVGPLLRQLSAQQTSLDEQTETARALNERIQALQSMPSAPVPESKLDAATAPRAPESMAASGGTQPETDLQVPIEAPGDQREPASESGGSFFGRYFAGRRNRADETARTHMENRCRACGYNNRADATFCRGCGVSLAKGVPPEPR
jgi:hypothetical protein